MPWILPSLPVLGLIAMAMSVSYALPLGIALALEDGTASVFAGSLLVNFVSGFLTWVLTRRFRRELQLREGILFIVLVWVGGALFACPPLIVAIGLSFTDGYFEAMS